MIYNVLFTGVGGEGVLSSSVILARAANFAGYEVKGTQLHGLAQRGGSVPIHLRFGKNVHSPVIPRASADLIIGLEPAETLKACYFADKRRTNFMIDFYPIIPVYIRLNKQKYPSKDEIEKSLLPFAKNICFAETSNICKEHVGSPVYGNVMAIGICIKKGWLPIGKKFVLQALKQTFPNDFDNNRKALEMGMNYENKPEKY